MKKNFCSVILLLMIFAGLAGCNNEQGNGSEAANETAGMEMEDELLSDYMDIKDALFNDNFEGAKQAAEDMVSTTEDEKIKQEVQQVANAQDIEGLRSEFAQLSQTLYNKYKGTELEQTLYWNHCPMALNDQGANWLSMQEEIQNPYMGQKMPKCGSVKEKIQ